MHDLLDEIEFLLRDEQHVGRHRTRDHAAPLPIPPIRLNVALAFAAAKWRMFPVGDDPDRPGKLKPLVTGWQRADGPATCDEDQIRTWAGDPAVRVLAIPTGRPFGYAVLDIDEKNGKSGRATLAAKGWEIPADATQWQTMSGGLHVLFAQAADGPVVPSDTGKLGVGIDRRGEGGYVHLWPVNGFAYTRGTIAAPPAWFVEGAVESAAPAPESPPRVGLTDEQLCDLVRRVNPSTLGDYDTWVRFGMALHHESDGSDYGRALFDWISSQAPSYQGKREIDSKWRSFGDYRGERITIRSFLPKDLASEAGAADRAKAAGFGADPLPPGASTTTPPPPGVEGVNLVRASDVEQTPIDWVWPGFLARKKVHLAAGRPEAGKTTVSLELVAITSRGGKFPDGTSTPAADCFIWSCEDDIADTLAPRLQAMGADMTRVHFIASVGAGERARPFDPATDMAQLRTAMEPFRGRIGILMIDPIVVIATRDSHNNASTRRDMTPLSRLTEDLNIATVGITHFSKGTKGQDPVERVNGSLAFGAIARIVWAVAQRPDEDGGGSIFIRAKGNIVKREGTVRGFVFHLHDTDLGRGIHASRVQWGESLEGSAQDILAQVEDASGEARGGPAVEAAADWLKAFLGNGPQRAKVVEEVGKGAGFSWASIRRAKESLGVNARKIGEASHWSLPLPGPTEAFAQPVPQEPRP